MVVNVVTADVIVSAVIKVNRVLAVVLEIAVRVIVAALANSNQYLKCLIFSPSSPIFVIASMPMSICKSTYF